MAISFTANRSTTFSTVGETSHSVDVSGVTSGKVAIITAVVTGGSTTDPAPTNGLRLGGVGPFTGDTETAARIGMWAWVGDGSTSSLTLQWDVTGRCIVHVNEYDGVDTSTPLSTTGGGANDTGSTNQCITGSITNPDATYWAITGHWIRTTTSGSKNMTFTPSGSLTERVDSNMAANTGSPWCGLETCDSNGAVTAAAHSYTATASITNSHRGGLLTYLVPASSGTSANAGVAAATGTAYGALPTPRPATNAAAEVAQARSTIPEVWASYTNSAGNTATVTSDPVRLVPGYWLVAIARAGRGGHSAAYSWSFTDSASLGTWVVDWTGAENPAPGNTFARQLAIAHVPIPANPGALTATVTADAWATADVGAWGIYVIQIPAPSASWLAQGPAEAYGATGTTTLTLSLPGASTHETWAVVMAEESLGLSIYSADEAGWDKITPAELGYYVGHAIVARSGDASGSTVVSWTAGDNNSASGVIFEIQPAATGTNASAGLAGAASGTAYNATTKASGNATPTTPSGAGTAQAPAASVKPPAGLAGAASGSAFSATTRSSGNTVTEVPQGTGTAQTPAPSVEPPGGVASGSGSAFNATVAISTSVPAGVAQASGSAFNATTTSSGNATATVAQATGTALNAVAQVGTRAQAGLASATGTGADASTRSSGNATAGVGAGTGTASAGAGGIGGGAGPSAGTGTASNATTKASGNAPAQLASATGAANLASAGSNVTASAGLAAATGTANNGAFHYATAEAASGSGTAYNATGAIRATTTAASATGAAQAPTGASGANPTAQASAGSGSAFNASARVAPTAPSAAGTGTGSDTGAKASPRAEVAQASGTAQTPTTTRAVAAQAGLAASTGTATPSTVSLARYAQAEAALALGAAYGPVAYTVAPGQATAQLAHAIATAYGADRRPIFIGGVPVLLEPQQLTVITPAQGGPDGFGNATWDYGVGASQRYIMGWIQQDQRAEGFIPGRDPKEHQWLLVTNDSGITARDRIYWGAGPTGPITFEIEGPPEPAYRPGGFHHTEATLRELVG